MKDISEDMPWLNAAAIEWLGSVLQPTWGVLETGAGGSTIYFARRVRSVRTYEHDQAWAREVGKRLIARRIGNVTLRLSPSYPAAGIGGAWMMDLAFIDGRGRVRSCIDVLPRIRPGGWLVLDDSDRERYREAHRAADLACAHKLVFRDGPDETTAWQKS